MALKAFPPARTRVVRSSRDELGHKNHSPGHGWDLELGKLKNEKIIMKKVV